jgi:FemAB-related protein (PEP-CTERM system-associated)
MATDAGAASQLMDRAVELADELDVSYLELRHAERQPHASFTHELTEKANLRLDLPAASSELWTAFDPKVRNQVRKAQKENLFVEWGQQELLSDFYSVICRNMRDLGTPVFSRRLFASMLDHLPHAAEICVVRYGRKPVAAAIVVHGTGTTEVPTASSLRRFNSFNGNMLLYWHLLMRSIERGQLAFDFGRSSAGSNTYRFKAQWGAVPRPLVWQYYCRRGNVAEMRPSHPKNQRRIAVWRRLPVWLTRLAGPPIVRGIP